MRSATGTMQRACVLFAVAMASLAQLAAKCSAAAERKPTSSWPSPMCVCALFLFFFPAAAAAVRAAACLASIARSLRATRWDGLRHGWTNCRVRLVCAQDTGWHGMGWHQSASCRNDPDCAMQTPRMDAKEGVELGSRIWGQNRFSAPEKECSNEEASDAQSLMFNFISFYANDCINSTWWIPKRVFESLSLNCSLFGRVAYGGEYYGRAAGLLAPGAEVSGSEPAELAPQSSIRIVCYIQYSYNAIASSRTELKDWA